MANNPWQYMPALYVAMTPGQRLLIYNLNPYDAVTNPLGLGEGGQYYNFLPWMYDQVANGVISQQQGALAASAANQQTAWVQESGTVSRVDASTITVAGFRTNVYTPNRAIQLDQTTDATGWVTSSNYNSDTGLTTITVCGCTVDTGLTALWFGQDPANAPKAASVGSYLYLFNTYTALGGY